MSNESKHHGEAEQSVGLTGVQYALYLTWDAVTARIAELEQIHLRQMVVVPFYDQDGSFDPQYIEVLAVREHCPAFLFEDDCRFGAARWHFDGNVFRAGVSLTEGMWMLRRVHRKLGTQMPDVMLREYEAREQLHRQNREAYLRIDPQACAAWAQAHIRKLAEVN